MKIRYIAIPFLLILFLSIEGAHGEKSETSGGSNEHSASLTNIMLLAEKGDAEAQLELGRMYLFGDGVPADEKKGVKLIRKAAKQGLPDAYGELGLMYYSGDGVSADIKKSTKYFRKAAELGEPGWLINLGLAYEDGSGVRKDKVKAYAYFYIASQRGVSDMYHNPETLAAQMTAEQVQKGLEIARKWWEKHCYNATKSKTCSENLNFGYYMDEKNRFGIVPPDEWEVYDNLGKGQILGFMGASTHADEVLYDPRIYIRMVRHSEKSKKADPVSAETSINMLYDNPQIIQTKVEKIGNRNATFTQFLVTTGAHHLKGIQVKIDCEDRVYYLTAVCAQANWEKTEETLLNSLNTFTSLD